MKNQKQWAYLLPSLALAAPTFADDEQNAKHQHSLQVEHVYVSAPLQKSEADTAMPVDVLHGEDLRNAATQNLGDTLAEIPGIAKASFGPGVGQPVIRGQQGARVQVLQNGVSSVDVSAVSADHAVAAEPLLADSIEVLKGPATLLYGGGAIGGVINVIDGSIPRAAGDSRIALELRHNSADDGNTGVWRIDSGTGNWAWNISGYKSKWGTVEIPGLAFNEANVDDVDESTDGYLDNSHGDASNNSLGLSHIGENGYIGISISEKRGNYGIPAVAEEHDHGGGGGGGHGHEDIRIDLEQQRIAVQAEQQLEGRFDRLRVSLQKADYEHSEIEGDGEVGTVFSNEGVSSRIELSHAAIGEWRGAVGVQWDQSDFSAVGEEAFVPATDREQLGLFYMASLERDSYSVELGARVDRNEQEVDADDADREFDTYSLSAAALMPINEHWSVGVALSESERAPSTEALYSNIGNTPADYVEHAATGVVEVGDENLEKETSRNIDLSLQYGEGRVSGFATVFFNDFSDYIYLHDTETLTADDVEIFAYQQQDVRFYGLEYEVNVLLGEADNGHWDMQLAGDWVEAELRSGEEAGEDLPRLSPRRTRLTLSYEGDVYQWKLSAQHADNRDAIGEHEAATASYMRYDASVHRHFSVGDADLTVFAKAKNISDEDIRLSTSLLRDSAPEAGRSLELGVRMSY